ncbi:MAG: sugar phosphate isomerase/epimerase [Candidatus Hydrogenedens sp.]|nr:sugar phosphate isomerase/epimerase [Candidatus Hydrogenedentota bacterium]NLF58661.1 sugar phosphate isomerase/epimerase [Candidatus Hydrogenedens sp.]
MKRWKLEFMASLGYSAMPPERVVVSLASIGYDAVGWTLAHFNPRTRTPEQLLELVATTRRAGLEVGEIVVQQDFVTLDDALRRDRVALCLECIAAAADCGLPVLNLFSGPAPWDPAAPVIGRDLAEGAAWDLVLRSYEPLAAAAEKHRVRLAVEGVWGMLCHDYYSTLPLVKHFNSPWVGVNFDPSHDILSGHLDSGWLARQWGGNIHHVHLKDAAGEPRMGKFVFPMLGEGLVPWAEFFQALDDIGYAGCCSVEYESFAYHANVLKGDTEAAARLSFEQVNALLP